MLRGLKDISKAVGVSDPRTVRKLIEYEHLPVIRIMGRYMMTTEMLNSWALEKFKVVSASTA